MKKLTTNECITKFIEVHGDTYDYSLVQYTNAKNKVKIICPKHGEFKQSPDNHITKKQGCMKCRLEKCSISYTLPQVKYINRFKEVHGDTYDYSLVQYKRNDIKIQIICPKHGIFEQRPTDHWKGNGCPKCNNISLGERIIMRLLDEKQIPYINQYRFSDCKKKKPLPFDFYLPEHNICIEVDGIHHFIPFSYGNNQSNEFKLQKFNEVKLSDEIKTNYCKLNNIPLYRTERLSYNEMVNFVDNIFHPQCYCSW